MRTFLMTTTALAMLTGFAVAQGSPNQAGSSKAPAAQSSTGQSGGTGASMTTQSKSGAVGATSESRPAAAGQPGIRQVDAASMRVVFYAVQPADMRASKLIGTDVYNLQNENIGEVEDLIIDNGKNVKGVVVSVGGFLGMGDRNVAVQPGSVVLNEQTDGSARMVINTTKEDLKNAPAFNFADVDKAGAGAATTGQADKTPPQRDDTPKGSDTRQK